MQEYSLRSKIWSQDADYALSIVRFIVTTNSTTAEGLENRQSVVSNFLGLKLSNSYRQKDKKAKTGTRSSRLEEGGFYVVNGIGDEQKSEGHLRCQNLHCCDDIKKGATVLDFNG
jgi:hypothetical protein